MKPGFYDVSTRELWEKRVSQAKANGWRWGTDFPQYEPTFDKARKWYHGNAKLILHLYYNDICDRYEMIVTTKTTLKTYPQYRGKRIEVI